MYLIPRRKAFWIQIAIGLCIVAACVLLARGVLASLHARGITSGFGFLDRSTGWDVAFSLVPYSTGDTYRWVIFVGLLNTIFLGTIGLVLATILGVLIGTMRVSSNPVISMISTCYVEVIRNIPLILQVLFWYSLYIHLPPPRQAIHVLGAIMMSTRGIILPSLNVEAAAAGLAVGALTAAIVLSLVLILLPRRSLAARVMIPKLIPLCLLAGVVVMIGAVVMGKTPGAPLLQVATLKGLNFSGGITISPELAAVLTGLSLYGGAFVGEIVRAGYLSVGKGQIEAAEALGLNAFQVLTKVRLPLALRMALPTLTNQYVWLLKATTLGIAVGFSDLFMVISTSINQSGQTLELIGILMASFLILNNALAAIMNTINRRIALRGNQLRM